MVLAGRPVSTQWEPFSARKTFTLVFDVVDHTRSDTSLIFIPEMHFHRNRLHLWASDEGNLRHDRTRQTVEYRHRRGAGEEKRKVVVIEVQESHSERFTGAHEKAGK
jgi:hypothetical protein